MDSPVDVCNACAKPASSRCAGCKSVAYCCKEHQKADWKAHKAQCHLLRKNQNALHHGRAGEYVGTFRWSDATNFPKMPPYPQGRAPLVGWQEFIGFRLDDDSEEPISVEPAMLDGLSFPLSLARATAQLRQDGHLSRQVLETVELQLRPHRDPCNFLS